MGHERVERRSLALHRAIAAKLRADPGLLEIARQNIRNWSSNGSNSQPYLDTWRELLNLPLEELPTLIQEDSPWMTELRQSNPFAGILEPKERWHIYDTFESGTHHPGSGDHR
jgi:hypothetical protein